MNDINWRYISEDDSLFLEENKHHRIIVETNNGTIWDTFARYVDRKHILTTCEYKVVRYAYYCIV